MKYMSALVNASEIVTPRTTGSMFNWWNVSWLNAKELLEGSGWFQWPTLLRYQDSLPFLAQPVCTWDWSDNEVRKESKSIIGTKIGECNTCRANPWILEPDYLSHFFSCSRYKRCISVYTSDSKIESTQTTQLMSESRIALSTRAISSWEYRSGIIATPSL